MRLLLNVESLAPPLTGIGTYTLEIATRLACHPAVAELRCFANSGFVDLGAMRQAARAGTRESRLRRGLRALPGAYEAVQTARHALTGWRLRHHADALYHEPNFLLRPFRGRAVATLHDISFIHYPEHHPRERVRLLERRLPETLRRAERLLTDSEFVRGEIIGQLGVAPERVRAVHLGIAPDYRPRDCAATAPLLDRLGLAHGRYLLAVATLEPRKNLERLLAAFLELPGELQRAFPLVLCGRIGWKSSALEREIKELARERRVRVTGYVARDELPLIYAGAAAFAFPSLYEGFGLPPLEAQACAVPVLISDRASLPEVTGGHALAVDPLDVPAMAGALERLLTDERLRETMRTAGPRHAAAFTWERTVEETVGVYAEAVR